MSPIFDPLLPPDYLFLVPELNHRTAFAGIGTRPSSAALWPIVVWLCCSDSSSPVAAFAYSG